MSKAIEHLCTFYPSPSILLLFPISVSKPPSHLPTEEAATRADPGSGWTVLEANLADVVFPLQGNEANHQQTTNLEE